MRDAASAIADFSAASFSRRAAAQTAHEPDSGFGDHVLNPDFADTVRANAKRAAAVLIAAIDDGEDARILLTQRTAAMRTHSGQVAFPGGAVDESDISAEAAAIREAQEEIGLDPALVTPVGRLPDYHSGSGFRITPVLAVVNRGLSVAPNPAEVDAVFEVPLSFLMNPANHRMESRIWQGKERFYYIMPYGDRYIWGVTAGIIRSMFERLYT